MTNRSYQDGRTGGGNDASGNYRNSKELSEVLIILLQSLMFGEAPAANQNQTQTATAETNSSMLIPRSQNQAEREGPSVQIMVMLVSLVCNSVVFSILVGEDRGDLFTVETDDFKSKMVTLMFLC